MRSYISYYIVSERYDNRIFINNTRTTTRQCHCRSTYDSNEIECRFVISSTAAMRLNFLLEEKINYSRYIICRAMPTMSECIDHKWLVNYPQESI